MRAAKANAVLTTVGDGTDMTMPSYSPAWTQISMQLQKLLPLSVVILGRSPMEPRTTNKVSILPMDAGYNTRTRIYMYSGYDTYMSWIRK